MEIVIKDIQYSEIITRSINKENTSTKLLKSIVKKVPPKVKNEMLIFFVSKNKYDIVSAINKYLMKKDIPVQIDEIELKKAKSE